MGSRCALNYELTQTILFIIMKSLLVYGLASISAIGAMAQSINVTPTGVGVGTATPSVKLEVQSNGAMKLGTAYLSSGGSNHLRLATNEWHNGTSWVTNGTAGSLLQQIGQETSFYAHDGAGTHTLLFRVKATGDISTTASATVGSLVVGTSTIFSDGQFTSSEKTIPGTYESLVVPHGLDGVPRFSTVALRCKIVNNGWAVGDEILLSSISMISNNHGVTTAVNSTDFKLIQYGYIYVHSFTTGGPIIATPENWRLIFRAWR